MTARTLGDLVLGFHFAFIVFSVLGGFLVLWKPWIAWIHLPSVLWSGYVNLFGQVCPLTPLENRFRQLAGEAGYKGGFIEHYLAPLVYPGVMPDLWGLISGLAVLIWNVLVYMLVMTRVRSDPSEWLNRLRRWPDSPRGQTPHGHRRSSGGNRGSLEPLGVRRCPSWSSLEHLAWVVLQTTNRTQAKGSTVRLVAPRAPEMAYERKPPPSEAELIEVEEYLLECGYVATTNIGLRWGTYTITPAGFSWLEGGLPERTDRLREIAKRPGREVALESAVRTDLEEETYRMEELESELEQMHRTLQVATYTAARESQKAESRLAGDTFQTVSERLPWWRRLFF